MSNRFGSCIELFCKRRKILSIYDFMVGRPIGLGTRERTSNLHMKVSTKNSAFFVNRLACNRLNRVDGIFLKKVDTQSQRTNQSDKAFLSVAENWHRNHAAARALGVDAECALGFRLNNSLPTARIANNNDSEPRASAREIMQWVAATARGERKSVSLRKRFVISVDHMLRTIIVSGSYASAFEKFVLSAETNNRVVSSSVGVPSGWENSRNSGSRMNLREQHTQTASES